MFLTHISGIPGVLARNAFPVEMAEKWKYPEGWRKRIEKGYVYKSASGVTDILNPDVFYPPMIFYARTTRDRLSGILFGLAVTIAKLRKQELQQLSHLRRKIKECQEISTEIETVVFNRLKSKLTWFLLTYENSPDFLSGRKIPLRSETEMRRIWGISVPRA